MHRGQESTPVALAGGDESEVTPSTEVQKGALLSCDLGNPGRWERSRPRTSPWLPGPLSSLQEHRDPSSLSLQSPGEVGICPAATSLFLETSPDSPLRKALPSMFPHVVQVKPILPPCLDAGI